MPIPIIEKSIPFHLLGIRDGDLIVGFQMANGNVVLQIAETSVKPDPKKDIREWMAKWAGSMTLEPGETRESLRDAAMQEKFGI